MVMNDSVRKDLQKYKNTFLVSLGIFAVLWFFSIIISYIFSWAFLKSFLWGFLCGGLLSYLNISALALAFINITIKKLNKGYIILPFSSFLLLCSAALLLVFFYKAWLFGFAVGLCSPLLPGFMIALGKK